LLAEHCKYFAEAARKATQESQETAKLHQENGQAGSMKRNEDR
jgi:hypothetical protein